MEPGRTHAYLQAACAGLGFDIGEVWFCHRDEDTLGNCGSGEISERLKSSDKNAKSVRNIKFLQLYTSKSYNNRRNELLMPASGDCEDIQKHVLSPKLVDAISTTDKVVWAHCPSQEREGLLGRSDMRLQTAVGIPFAADSDGNMCVVVMFSPKNMRTNLNAMEYLRLFMQTTKSPLIPCLLPIVDSNQQKLFYNPQRFNDWQEPKLKLLSGENDEKSTSDAAMVVERHEMTRAPKDPYGIPILPSIAELDTAQIGVGNSSDDFDAFDQATYGVWSTVMNMSSDDSTELTSSNAVMPKASVLVSLGNKCDSLLSLNERTYFRAERRDRLEEFTSAFLRMSVFDLADIWIPILSGCSSIGLHHLCSVSVTERNEGLECLMQVSQNSVIKAWSGAVGRTYSSGNSIWDTNQNFFVDCERADAFTRADIKTVLAVPIYSPINKSPSGVMCCYSLIRSESVPLVLKFVQQALRTLWMGLNHVEPDRNIDRGLWRGVAPVDLGEMAADVELQETFYNKKRSFDDISSDRQDKSVKSDSNNRSFSLSGELQSLNIPSVEPSLPLNAKAEIEMNNNRPVQVIKTVASLGKYSVPLEHQNANHLEHPSRLITPVALLSNDGQAPTINGDLKRLHIEQSTPCAVKSALQSSLYPVVPDYSYQSVAPSNHKEDPFVAIGNINEINALVQMSQNQYRNELVRTKENMVICQKVGVESPLPPTLPKISQSNGHVFTKKKIDLSTGISGETCFTKGHHFLPIEFNPSVSTKSIRMPEAFVSLTAPQCLPNKSGKNCRIEGCDDLTISRRPYCLRHSGPRLCEHSSCSKCAQGATRFCIGHGGGRRCTYPGCDKGARDKYYCAAHGGGRRCKEDGCKRSAVGGSELCTSHGGGRRCVAHGCRKSAQSSTKFCVKHGGGRRCAVNDCGKVARGRTLYCAGHGGGIRCKLDGCNRIAIGKMQLCRTHGGGSGNVQLSVPSITAQCTPIPSTKSTLSHTHTKSSTI